MYYVYVYVQDKAPALPFEAIKVAIEYDLNNSIENIFNEFNQNAIGAASLA